MEQQQLQDACLCAIKFLDKYSGAGAKTKRYHAFKALAELTLADLGSGKQGNECEYNAYDVLEKITGKYSVEETDKRRINQYLKDLTKHLPEHEDMLKSIAMENNLIAIPCYDFSASPGGGSGNYSTHFITPIALNEADKLVSPEKTQEDTIKYYLETIDNLPIWVRWLNNFELSEWRIKAIVGLMILALIVGLGMYFMFMAVFLNSQSVGLDILRTFIGTLVIGIVVLWPFRVLYLCLTNRIISAPFLLQPSDINNIQIECFATDKIRESTGRPVRTLRIVSYASICPLCDSRIEVESGDKEFHHRLIGRCIEAPIEHVYSFDRKLRIGRALRNN